MSPYLNCKQTIIKAKEFIQERQIMRLLHVTIEIHFFSQNQSNDDQIERRKQGYGLFSPGFYKWLLKYQDKTVDVQFDEHTTLGGFQDLIYKTIWDGYSGAIDGSMHFYFMTLDARYSID